MVKNSLKAEIEFNDRDDWAKYKSRFVDITKTKSKKKGFYVYKGKRADITDNYERNRKPNMNVNNFSVVARDLEDLRKKLKKKWFKTYDNS